ncbi:MAG: aldo/keto reductase [Pirellulales bacterium]|nr:aldo/keto reductase [Pirellulales bacterium]
MEYRTLGDSGIEISAVTLGCWPLAGMTSPGATDENGIATINECFELGVNHLDTAYMYGAEGESELLIARALKSGRKGSRRDEMVIATKGGLHWEGGERGPDGRPETLRRECEESLRRLATDRVELYYLHAPDPKVPVAESAGELKRLLDEGKARAIGVSNVGVAQLEAFNAECPITAYQPPYNMLQREIEADTLPWCREHNVAVLVYWPLLKGLLAGSITRDTVFAETDSRRKYRMFLGQEWEKNHDLVDELRSIASECGHTVAELVVNWTINRPGISSALCGAKRPEQIRETAAAAGWKLSSRQLAKIDAALERRGKPDVEPPV